jgi:hypothetical protein
VEEQARVEAEVNVTDPIATVAAWLAGHVEWMRHRPECDEFMADVEACARIVAGIARGPASQRYLGPCGAQQPPTEYGIAQGFSDGGCCVGDIYAREGAQRGACRTCGATVGVEDRRAWLDAEVRSHAFRAVEIAQAYGVNANTIRSWAARGQLVPHGHDSDGRPLFNVGDVLDLAAADAARRATEQAKRARRATAKAADIERITA